jgi:predicted nucleic acid-binding protein
MNAVFLDTVGLLALWDIADQWHMPAEEAFAEIVADRRPLITTTFVLLECGNAAARRPYRAEVVRLKQLLMARDELLIPMDDDISQAWRDYEQGQAGDAGIVDHVSFAVMQRLNIRQAFTNDKHFEAAGFEILF